MEGQLPGASNHLPAMDLHQDDAGDDEEVAETDPEGRYYRYVELVGRGRFKCIYKAFDTQIGEPQPTGRPSTVPAARAVRLHAAVLRPPAGCTSMHERRRAGRAGSSRRRPTRRMLAAACW